MEGSPNRRWISRIISPCIPYITIGIGLLLLHNAWITIIGYHVGIIIVILLSPAKFTLKQLGEIDLAETLVGNDALELDCFVLKLFGLSPPEYIRNLTGKTGGSPFASLL